MDLERGPSDAAMPTETTSLLRGDLPGPANDWLAFLEAQTPNGRRYERFMIVLILLNVLAFVLGTLFVPEYSDLHCPKVWDAYFFGNDPDNGLYWLQVGTTSWLEVFTVAIFTGEYMLRLFVTPGGWRGKLRYIVSFFSLVDLASTLPFYVDALFLRHSDLANSSFLRMFRLFRMMKVEGRYETALTLVDDVYRAQKGILGTALFVGVTTWLTVSALYYLVERRNVDLIYCPSCPDASDCRIDDWGQAFCTDCQDDNCYNLYESIPMASYYALLNLFGEFPLIDQHSPAGQVVGTLTAVVAVAVFALPVGIIGNGFESVIAARNQADAAAPIVEQGGMTRGYQASETTFRGRLYNWLHHSPGLDYFINSLIVLTALSFMLDTLGGLPPSIHVLLDSFELISVTVFTVEYVARWYVAVEDPKYPSRWRYVGTFLSIVDLLSFVPYWIEVCWTGKVITASSDSSSSWSNAVKGLRLLRILRFEKYTHAFTSFDDVITRNQDVLAVTAFTALLFWVFFSAFLYFSERDNPDPEMAANYNTMPNSMWVTLLNLSGEAPLSQYSAAGKFVTGVLGLFATG